MAQWSPQQLQQMAALLQGTHNTLAVDAAVANAPVQRWAVDAQGQRIDPYAANPATAAIESAAPRAPIMAPAPTMAYAGGAPGSAPAAAPPQPAQASGRMRFNPLFGTPIGALLNMFGGKGRPGGLIGLMAKMPAMNAAQRYAAANSGPGSVAAMELKHSGASRNPQSGGPAVGGEYASGGR